MLAEAFYSSYQRRRNLRCLTFDLWSCAESDHANQDGVQMSCADGHMTAVTDSFQRQPGVSLEGCRDCKILREPHRSTMTIPASYFRDLEQAIVIDYRWLRNEAVLWKDKCYHRGTFHAIDGVTEAPGNYNGFRGIIFKWSHKSILAFMYAMAVSLIYLQSVHYKLCAHMQCACRGTRLAPTQVLII